MFRLMAMGGSLIVPALASASIPSTTASTALRTATLVMGVIAAIGTAGYQVVRPPVRARSARIAYAALTGEGWAFFTRTGRYATDGSAGATAGRPDPFTTFSQEVSAIIERRQAQYLGAFTDTDGGPDQAEHVHVPPDRRPDHT